MGKKGKGRARAWFGRRRRRGHVDRAFSLPKGMAVVVATLKPNRSGNGIIAFQSGNWVELAKVAVENWSGFNLDSGSLDLGTVANTALTLGVGLAVSKVASIAGANKALPKMLRKYVKFT